MSRMSPAYQDREIQEMIMNFAIRQAQKYLQVEEGAKVVRPPVLSNALLMMHFFWFRQHSATALSTPREHAPA
jgi:hypothetical protein